MLAFLRESQMVKRNLKALPADIKQRFPLIFAKEWATVLALIFGGCCSNVFTLETLIKAESQSGNLITFSQFLFLAFEGLCMNLEYSKSWLPLKLKQRQVPIKNWLIMVFLFWGVSVLNNYALGFSIPMPFHIIFRSASLIVSMLNGWMFFQRKFSHSQVLGVLIVTVAL
jgi:UDP-xylose/UDP-N-acetylglucosamine transporter B4